MEKGVRNIYQGVSIVPNWVLTIAKGVEGVEEVVGIIMLGAVYEIDGFEQDLMVVTHKPGSSIGAPWSIIRGRSLIEENEVVIDQTFAKKAILSLGDQLEILGSKFTIVGLTKGASNIFGYYVFIHQNKGQQLLRVPDSSTFVGIKIKESFSAESVQQELTRLLPSVNVLTKNELIDTNTQKLESSFLPIIWGIVVLGIMIGTAVIGLTTYTATIDKEMEYGVLKAIGISNTQLYLLVLEQSFISTTLGLILGTTFSFVVGVLFTQVIPFMIVEITFQTALSIAMFAVVTSLVAALIPTRRIARIDPAGVFK